MARGKLMIRQSVAVIVGFLIAIIPIILTGYLFHIGWNLLN
jgi:hypothetical protein